MSLKNWHDECAIFGIVGTSDSAKLTVLGLHAMQHRGQEASGIITVNGKPGRFAAIRSKGLVSEVFSNDKVNDLVGDVSIGHNRYSTTSASDIRSLQPLFAELECGGVALAHNGNITNAKSIRKELQKLGSIFQSYSDSEVILQLMSYAKGSMKERIIAALSRVEGAYSLVLLTNTSLFAVRDPRGIRPLQLGKVGDALAFASESCAFDIMGGELLEDLKSGELIEIDRENLNIERYNLIEKQDRAFCVFEYIYFSRPDSFVEGKDVYSIRKAFGARLADESPAPEGADIVVPVPDSGVAAALGFAERANIPFDLGIIRNHYVGRTFIEPEDKIRHLGVKLKHNANQSLLTNKSVVLVDDSLVRGTTSHKIVQMLRSAGAREVHMRISSPPMKFPCYYGVDTPAKEELIASHMSKDEINKKIGSDSLAYLSMEGVLDTLKDSSFCSACFDGNYPTKLDHDRLQYKELPLLTIKQNEK